MTNNNDDMRNPVKISFFTYIFIFHTDSFNNNTDIFYTIIIIFPANFRYFSEAAVTTLFLFLLFIFSHATWNTKQFSVSLPHLHTLLLVL